jgi:hypothetical protein
MIKLRAIAFGAAFLLSALPTTAQVLTGSIIGTVTDESRSVLPGVSATLQSSALQGRPREGVTDEQGRYRFTNLPPGTYTLTLTLSGFATYQEEDLRVITGGTVERNLILTVAAVAETITVSGQSPMVDTRNVGVTVTTTREVIENIPTIRGVTTDFLQVLPGVVAVTPGRYSERVQIMGSPITETTYIYDGVMANHPGRGDSWQGGDIDALEEIQTYALGASAEYALSGGGVVTAVTKSGTNSFRGDATAYWKPNRLQSHPITVNCNCPLGETGFNLGRMRDLSAHAGGPLLRDRLWYFAGVQNYEFTHSEPGVYPPEQPTNHWHKGQGKVTWQATPTLRVSQLLRLEWWGGYGGPSRTVAYEAATKTLEAHIHTYATEVHKTFGNATVLSVRAGGLWEPNLITGPLTGDLVTPNRTDNLTGRSTQGAQQIGRTVVRRDQQAVKLERYVARSRTTHTLRTGLQFEEVNDLRQTAWPSNVQYYDFGGAPDYALFREPSSQGAAYTTQGVWAEDQITIGNRVTLDLGVRFDRMHAVSNDLRAIDFKLEETGATIPGLGSLFTWKLWAPRLGVNFKLTGDGRMVLRSTYGRAYRQILPFELDTIHPGISSVTQARFSPATGGYTDIVSVTNSRSNIAVDPNLTAPRQDTFSIGVDRQLLPQVAVNTSYVYKHGENLLGWSDIRGVYGPGTAVLPDGRTLPTMRLLVPTSQRLFQWTNRPDYVDNYHGFVASLVKRLSHRWHGQVNLTLSKSEGLRGTGSFGQDPNDLTNGFGRLTDTDRPVMFTANGSYDLPWIDVRISGNYQNISGRTFAPFASVVLPQGRRDIKIEAAGAADAFRAPRTSVLNLRIDKMLSFGAHRKLELIANVVNALQSTAPSTGFATFNFFSATYAQPTSWVQPRQLYVGARVNF